MSLNRIIWRVPWSGSWRRGGWSWGISSCRCRCPCAAAPFWTIRLSGMRCTFAGAGGGVAAGGAGVVLLVVAHASAPPAEGVGLLVALTEGGGSSRLRQSTLYHWLPIIYIKYSEYRKFIKTQTRIPSISCANSSSSAVFSSSLPDTFLISDSSKNYSSSFILLWKGFFTLGRNLGDILSFRWLWDWWRGK